MANVGYATVSIIPSAKGFGAALNKEVGPASASAGKVGGRSAGSGFKGGFLGAIKGMAAPIAATLGITAIGGFVKSAVDEASGLQEAGTALKTVFGEGYAEIVKFSEQGAATLGQSKLEAQKAAQSFGVYGKAAGLSGKENAKFSSSLVGLGTDLASFYDSSPEEAIAAIGSGLRGEAEPLRKFGVLLDDATLKAQAMKMGLIKNTKEALSPQNKVLAAQAVIMTQSKVAQGDFAKTSGGLANKQRILAGSFKDLKARVGQEFLPVFTKVTGVAADFVKGMTDGTGAGGAFAAKVKEIADAVKGFIADFKSGEGAAGTFRAVLEKTGAVISSVAGFLRDNAQTVKVLGSMILGAVAVFKIYTTYVKIAAAAQVLMNIAMTANPIGIVVVALGALVGGLIYAYKNSETFRRIVSEAWDTVKVGALQLAKVAVLALRGMVNMFLTVVSTLVSGAAKAFGWVPGLGPKLEAAAGKIEGFKKSANLSLDKVQKDLEIAVNTAKADKAMNAFRARNTKPLSIDAFVNVKTRSAGRVNIAGKSVNIGQRANGGPVTKGTPYIVGENRPELFVPESNGRIVPRVPGGGGGAGITQTNHFHGITNAEEAAAASVTRLTFATRTP